MHFRRYIVKFELQRVESVVHFAHLVSPHDEELGDSHADICISTSYRLFMDIILVEKPDLLI